MVGLVLVAAALGVSNFAAATALGLSGADAPTRLRVAVVFGVFETAMPLVGLAAGRPVVDAVGGNATRLGAALLVVVGVHEVVAHLRRPDRPSPPTRGSRLVLAGLALSLDNLAVGFGLAALTVSILVAAVTIGLVSVTMSLAGLELGARLGASRTGRGDLLAGMALVGVGVAMGAGAFG